MHLADSSAPALSEPTPLPGPDAPRHVVPAASSLAGIAREVRSLDKEAHVGPLKSALRLADLDNEWERYQEEAGGLTFNEWCAKAFGNPKHADIVRRRVGAVDKCKSLGYTHTFATGTFNHAVLVYLMGRSIPDKRRAEMVKLAAAEQKARHNVLPYQIIRNMVIDALGKQKRPNGRQAALDVALAHIRDCHEAAAQKAPLPPIPKALSHLL